MGLYSFGNIAAETFRDINDAIYFAVFQQGLCFLQVAAMGYDLQVGSRIYQSQVFAAEAGTVVVHYGGGDFAHRFIGIYKGVEQRVTQRNHDKENKHTLILYHRFQFLPPNVEKVGNAL